MNTEFNNFLDVNEEQTEQPISVLSYESSFAEMRHRLPTRRKQIVKPEQESVLDWDSGFAEQRDKSE